MIRLRFLRPILGLLCLSFGVASPVIGQVAADVGLSIGTREFEVLGGAFTSENEATFKRPRFTFEIATARVGWMLNNARSGFFFGNEEFLIEAFAGPISQGIGSVTAGGTLLLRHNFSSQPMAFFIPYFQIGTGGVYTDTSEDKVQLAIGAPVEFNLQATLGARWRVNRAWSVNTEFGYRHISNAGLATRNGGVDFVGGILGLGSLF